MENFKLIYEINVNYIVITMFENIAYLIGKV